jgi:hypothetical protein
MKEYKVIRKRTLAEPHIVIMFVGTMVACQHYLVCHSGPFEVVEIT